MKTIEITIRMTVEDDIKLEEISLYNHDVCDGFEIIRNGDDNTYVFKMRDAYIKNKKKNKKNKKM